MKKTTLPSKRIISLFLTVLFVLLTISCLQPAFQVDAATDYTFCFPVNNGVKIAYYQGYTEDYGGTHTGIDIHSYGDDTIYAAYSGVVQQTYNKCPHEDSGASGCGNQDHYNHYGNSVYIKGDNGLYFIYGHLKQNTILVKAGQRVTAGQPLATMGSSGASTGKHLHFEVRKDLSNGSSRINANPVGKYGGVVTYLNGPYGKLTPTYTAEKMAAGDYYLKNSSTGTYLTVDGAKAANKQNISVAKKSEAKAFQFKLSGGTSNYLSSLINTNFVVNPLSDAPGNGTNVTLYTKDNSGTQLWKFEKVSGGYIIHSAFNDNCVLGISSTNVQLQTRTGKDTQKWVLEEVNAATLSKITVTANPSKTSYYTGTEFDPAGMQITATYSDNSTKDVTAKVTAKYDFSKAGSNIVTFYYTENDKTVLASVTVTVQDIPTDVFAGSGTEDDPYQISSREELIKMRDLVNDTELNPQYGTAYYIQTADIDLGNQEWMPIGPGYDGENADGAYNYKTRMFYGSYDGNGHYITNLKVTNPLNRGGLFGFVKSNGTLGRVRNLVVTGAVNVTDATCGGIVGEAQYGAVIENCAFIGDVTGSIVGGITGAVWNGGTITNCYHTGKLSGSTQAAGIAAEVAFNDNAANTKQTLIENCYHANGAISGSTLSGAIVANIKRTNADDSKVLLINCFATTTSAASTNPDGVTTDTTLLRTNSEMKQIAEDLGGSFVYNEKADLNGGYPVFDWQLEQSCQGDVNEDGVADVLDAVQLQKWVLAVPDITLNSNAADMNNDSVVDVFDLAILKRQLIGG